MPTMPATSAGQDVARRLMDDGYVVVTGMMTPDGCRTVGAMEKLRVLRVYGGGAGDEGLRALTGLKELEILVLEGVGATDAGVEALAALPKLKKLTLHEPKVGDAALVRLRAALPAAEIAR